MGSKGKREARARAEQGIVFRDGHLVNKAEWDAAHPTKTVLLERQAAVDAAVKAEMAKKEQAQHIPNRYYCTACRKHHLKTSKIGSEHTNFYLEEA
jgi:hypothetical protein